MLQACLVTWKTLRVIIHNFQHWILILGSLRLLYGYHGDLLFVKIFKSSSRLGKIAQRVPHLCPRLDSHSLWHPKHSWEQLLCPSERMALSCGLVLRLDTRTPVLYLSQWAVICQVILGRLSFSLGVSSYSEFFCLLNMFGPQLRCPLLYEASQTSGKDKAPLPFLHFWGWPTGPQHL